jgi:hypothetical protein
MYMISDALTKGILLRWQEKPPYWSMKFSHSLKYVKEELDALNFAADALAKLAKSRGESIPAFVPRRPHDVTKWSGVSDLRTSPARGPGELLDRSAEQSHDLKKPTRNLWCLVQSLTAT